MTDVAEVTPGGVYTCVRHTSGSASCWGDVPHLSARGRLRAEGTIVPVQGLDDAVQLAAGEEFLCALRPTGRVDCWGRILRGLWPDWAPERQAVTVPDLDDAVQIVARSDVACARRRSGRVTCWSNSPQGIMGDLGGYEAEQRLDIIGVVDAVDLAVGTTSACACTAQGEIWCWGELSWMRPDSSEPPGPGAVRVAGLEGVTQLAVGARHACARRGDGRVLCWGQNGNRQLGAPEEVGSSSVPLVVPDLDGIEEIALAEDSSCARRSDGQVLCWGGNTFGTLGDGSRELRPAPRPLAAFLPPWSEARPTQPAAARGRVIQIAAGRTHTCELRDSGQVFCWGDNFSGMLGDGSERPRPLPVAVPGLDDAVEIGARETLTCVRRRSGSVVCWPARESDELLPNQISGVTDATDLAVGSDFACASLRGGTVTCWGDNLYRQLGVSGDVVVSGGPVAVPGVTGATVVVAGSYHACARTAEGHTTCWGHLYPGVSQEPTRFGRFDDAPEARLGWDECREGSGVACSLLVDEPATLRSLGEVADYRVGGSARFRCALTRSGEVFCWGSNWLGQLGDGTFENRPAPTRVAGVSEAVGLALGGEHACALRRDGQVLCWGEDRLWQLGRQRGLSPVVPGTEGATSIAAAQGQGCAILSDGTVRCWGTDRYGQLGSSRGTDELGPTTVPGLAGVRQIAPGLQKSCALITDGSVRCWGDWFSSRRGTVGSYGSFQVSNIASARAIGVGRYHACALLESGDVWCWGSGDSCNLAGEHRSEALSEPRQIPGLSGVTQLSVGGDFACAVLRDGSVRCWGDNEEGQLGDGTTEDRCQPVAVASLRDVTEVAAGVSHACARSSSGDVWCWGAGRSGELGDDRAANRPRAAPVPHLTGAVELDAGDSLTCARTGSAGVLCWGDTSQGQCGRVSSDPIRRPTAVPWLADAEELALGDDFGCARFAQGVRCWGNSLYGVQGDGGVSSAHPAPVAPH